MKPSTVITGIVLGTCLSIAVSLAAVMLMFVVLGDDYPRVNYEFDSLTTSLAVFSAMTAISAVSFYGLLVRHPTRLVALALMWAGVAATAWFYWP